METKGRLRSIVGGSIGNLVEWYDWYAYSALSLYFAKVFFPKGDATAQLLNTAGVFAIGFLMRPIGGWLLGLYADKRGRKAALLLSVVMMCVGSLIVALTPGYARIGVAAPILLVIARLVQGLSVGGEYGASATYLSEMATDQHRGFWASFQYVTLVGGQLTALAVLLVLQATLGESAVEGWAWRLPFAAGAVLAVVALWLRQGIDETHDFETVAPAERHGLLKKLAEHPRQILTVVGLTAGGTVAFYTFTTYMQKFLANSAGFSKPDATLISAGSLLVFTLLQPAMGALSDRVGRRPVLIAFGVLGLATTVPIMTALGGTKDVGAAFLLVTAALAVNACYSSISGLVKAELFPTEVRALGVGLPYAFAVSLFGGTAEYVALWFKSAGHESWFYWYVTGCIGLSLLVYLTMPEPKKVSTIRG